MAFVPVSVPEIKYVEGKKGAVLQVWLEEGTPELEGYGEVYYSPRSLMRASRSRRFYELGSDSSRPHFLKACYLCERTLGESDDIFMYRGDTPFCSEECRQRQIDADEAKEKSWSSMQLKKKSTKSSPTSDQEEASPSLGDDLCVLPVTVSAVG